MTRASIITAALTLVLTSRLPAQQLDETAKGVRVRARLCAAPATGASAERRAGIIAGHDSAVLVLAGRDSLDRLPMARLQLLEANTRPPRDLRAIGLIAGLLVGPVAAVSLGAKDADGSGVELAFIPVGLLVGGIGGYWLGRLASDDGAWRPLSLAPGQGSGC